MTDQPPATFKNRFGPVAGPLIQLSCMVHRELESIAGRHGLSLTQGRLLVALLGQRPTMSAIADLLYLERSSTSGLVSRAERHGLVVRYRDGGQTLVSLTESGRRMAHELSGEVLSQMDVLCTTLDAQDRAGLEDYIGRLTARTWDEDADLDLLLGLGRASIEGAPAF